MYAANDFYVEITTECNLRCIHCYNDSGIEKHLLMPDVIERIIGKEFAKDDISVTLSGGEPLKHPYFLEFLDILRFRKIRAGIITNATLIDFWLAKKLSEYDIDIQVSINGTSGYIHDKICGNGNFEKLCISSEETDEVLKVVYQNNDIMQMVDKGKLKLKVPELTFGCPILDDTQETISIAPRIAANGDVFICQIFSDPEYSIGNINQSTMEEILNSRKLLNLVEVLREGQQRIKSCEKCVWKTSCSKGCIGMAIHNGGISETDGQCSIRKKIFMKELKAFVS